MAKKQSSGKRWKDEDADDDSLYPEERRMNMLDAVINRAQRFDANRVPRLTCLLIDFVYM